MKSAACDDSRHRESGAAMASRDLPRSSDVLLVAVGFGPHSRAALRWAGEFACALGLRLRLVHGASERLPVEPLFPMLGSRQGWHCESLLGSLHEVLQNWASREVGVRVPLEDVCVELCEPAALILRESARSDVKLVILGGLPSEASAESSDLPQALLRHCPRPMLFVGPQGPQPVIVAATDCSDPALPVLTAAWRLAGALGDQVILVHNVDALASQFAARIGLPLTAAIADCVAQRSREWLEETAVTSEVIITREDDNAQAILGVARTVEADLLVVGVKPEDKARHGTAERILKEARRSVLFVPLPGRPAAA